MTAPIRQTARCILILAGGLFMSAGLAAARTAQAADHAVQARLSAGCTGSGERLSSLDTLRLFYGKRDHRPAWIVAGVPAPQVDELATVLSDADREGLRPADYHAVTIGALLARLRAAPGSVAAGDAADLDLLLSDAFFLYAAHLTAGRIRPEALEPEWNISGRERNLVALLEAALERGHLAATLRDLPPGRQDYRLLRDALAKQRSSAAAGAWPLVPGGPPLRAGDRGPRVAALRRRLSASGDLPVGDDAAGDLFDALLTAALGRFQARHGLDADGIVGRRTLAALNVPAIRRAWQIEANLERLRWLPGDLGKQHLLVNVADFRLELIEGNAPTLGMRIIAGRLARRTPFFTGEITSIILNPTWTVPEKIVIEDKLPLIFADQDFLRDHGFRVFAPVKKGWREIDPDEIDWTRVSDTHFPYVLRQDPGPKNALGRIKFQIPNRYDIYLHDTPARELFARSGRLFSSGCIRVERAVDLAERLLAADPIWRRQRLEETIAAGATVSVRLPAPVPVYLLYWTAWVDRDGVLQFREDVYGRDPALLRALGQPLAGSERLPRGSHNPLAGQQP